jgi:hypothetical protein
VAVVGGNTVRIQNFDSVRTETLPVRELLSWVSEETVVEGGPSGCRTVPGWPILSYECDVKLMSGEMLEWSWLITTTLSVGIEADVVQGAVTDGNPANDQATGSYPVGGEVVMMAMLRAPRAYLDSWRMKGLWLAVVLFAISNEAFAESELVTARQSFDGQVHVTLSGVIIHCGGVLGGFNGTPVGSVFGASLTIVSEGYGPECAPPGVPPPEPEPYSLTINFGVLPPGVYDIRWQVNLPPRQPLVATTQFEVLGTSAPVPVPANRFGSLLAFGVLAAAWGFLRKLPR